MSFRNKKDKEHLLKKAKEMEEYTRELVECLEDARHGEYDDYEDDDDYMYQERGRRMSMRGMRSRYGYR
ncbi:MAG: hypothetical protein IJU02_07200 [Lachnospiraceae bacterium]|nr:hypothetical protein [Lachnospiraceae bacterium]